ncbi:olfactory receptor 52K1-like [Discoglossus pictus]
MSILANTTVIALIILKKHLHQPMYIIIANLALSDLLFDTITLPKIIAKYWFGAASMSFFECMFQLFWIHHLGSVDSFIIMLMAVDRYVAICKPLHYSSLMTNKLVVLICYLNVMLLCLYTFGPHMANPVVYCLRTKEIKQTIENLIKRTVYHN